jgi:hypothetical protein
MTPMTPLEQAVVALNRHPNEADPAADRQARADDAVALAETKTFSIQSIILITGLPRSFGYELLAGRAPRQRGAKLNVAHLPLILDIANGKARGYVDKEIVRSIVKGGTSPRMLSRLTGIHHNTIYTWVGRQDATA